MTFTAVTVAQWDQLRAECRDSFATLTPLDRLRLMCLAGDTNAMRNARESDLKLLRDLALFGMAELATAEELESAS